MTFNQSQFNLEISKKVIKKAQKGQLKAHEIIYSNFADAVFHLALSITHDKFVAEDILQNTFVNVLNKIDTFQFKAPFGMWLRKIAVNQTLMSIRTAQDKEKRQTMMADNIIAITTHHGEQYLSHQPNMQLPDAQIDLSILLSQLPLQTRTVLWLKEVEGYTHKEIATMLNKSESYSKAIVARTYDHLRKQLTENHPLNYLEQT